MRATVPETRRKRIWYGPMAQVTLGARFLHWAGFDGVRVPHPPLANWLLRIGMSEESKRRLAFAHEFAHFDTVPIAMLYLGALFVFIYSRGRFSLASILMAIVSTHAAWEMLAEGLVVLESPADYRQSYNSLPQLPRILFWLLGTVLALAGWVVAI